MLSPKLSFTLALALLPSIAHAASDSRAHTNEGLTLVAANFLDNSILVIPAGPAVDHRAPVSAGIAESLPDLPGATVVQPVSNAFLPQSATEAYRQQQKNVADANLPDEPGMLSLVQASPIRGIARRIQAQRFNTDDGVTEDFAICYRFNRRSSLQVIPGDPAPVKLPTSALAGSDGVTVGMVIRLSGQR